MADSQIGSPLGVTSVGGTNTTSNFNGGTSWAEGFDMVGAHSVEDIRAALTTADATYYTEARLNQMTYNDMVYALRVISAPGSIK